MRKPLIFLAILILFASCASTHQVGRTKEAAKSQRDNSNRVGTQFIGVR